MNFQQRFQGKTTQLTKNGITGLLKIDDSGRRPFSQPKKLEKKSKKPIESPYLVVNPYQTENDLTENDYMPKEIKLEKESQEINQIILPKTQLTLPTPKKYKPYSIREYNDIKKMGVMMISRGLGPNTNTDEWKEKKEKIDKMNNFAMNVKLVNSQKLSELKPIKNKIINEENPGKIRRNKAIEFAKNIPKPLTKNKNNPEKTEKNIENVYQNELERLESIHKRHLQEIGNLCLKNI